jgi:hypothetical protein
LKLNPARLGSDSPDHATQGLATTQLRAGTERSPNRRKVRTKNGGKQIDQQREGDKRIGVGEEEEKKFSLLNLRGTFDCRNR